MSKGTPLIRSGRVFQVIKELENEAMRMRTLRDHETDEEAKRFWQHRIDAFMDCISVMHKALPTPGE